MKHRRPYMLRYVAQIESANAHQKDFFEITFGETRLSENRKTWVVIEFGGNCMALMEFQYLAQEINNLFGNYEFDSSRITN